MVLWRLLVQKPSSKNWRVSWKNQWLRVGSLTHAFECFLEPWSRVKTDSLLIENRQLRVHISSPYPPVLPLQAPTQGYVKLSIVREVFLFTGKVWPNFNLLKIISTYTKDFSLQKKKTQICQILEYIIARFLWSILVGSQEYRRNF